MASLSADTSNRPDQGKTREPYWRKRQAVAPAQGGYYGTNDGSTDTQQLGQPYQEGGNTPANTTGNGMMDALHGLADKLHPVP